MSQQLMVPLDAALVGEFFAREGKDADLAAFLRESVRARLEQLAGHGEKIIPRVRLDFWWHSDRGSICVPGGTKVQMRYNGQKYNGEAVGHGPREPGLIRYHSSLMAPTAFASRVANGTSRNAWRDILFEIDGEWLLADVLRRTSPATPPAPKPLHEITLDDLDFDDLK